MRLCDCGECEECLTVSRGRLQRELDAARQRITELERQLAEAEKWSDRSVSTAVLQSEKDRLYGELYQMRQRAEAAERRAETRERERDEQLKEREMLIGTCEMLKSWRASDRRDIAVLTERLEGARRLLDRWLNAPALEPDEEFLLAATQKWLAGALAATPADTTPSAAPGGRLGEAAYFKGAEDELMRHFREGGCKNAIAAASGRLEDAFALIRDAMDGPCADFDADCWNCRAHALLASTPGSAAPPASIGLAIPVAGTPPSGETP